MSALKTIIIAAALIWTIILYPIYPFLGLMSALIAIGLFFRDETTDNLIKGVDAGVASEVGLVASRNTAQWDSEQISRNAYWESIGWIWSIHLSPHIACIHSSSSKKDETGENNVQSNH